MSTKELALNTIQELPDDASFNEIEERIRFLAAIEKGREDVRAGNVVPHEEVRDLLKEWTTRESGRILRWPICTTWFAI